MDADENETIIRIKWHPISSQSYQCAIYSIINIKVEIFSADIPTFHSPC